LTRGYSAHTKENAPRSSGLCRVEQTAQYDPLFRKPCKPRPASRAQDGYVDTDFAAGPALNSAW